MVNFWRNLCVILICLLVLSLIVNYHYFYGYDHVSKENAELKQKSDSLISISNKYLDKQKELEGARDSIRSIRKELLSKETELRNYKYEKPKDLPYRVNDMQLWFDRKFPSNP